MSEKEYNPLDYENLTINLVRELMSRGPFALPLDRAFSGPGVYALFYDGDFAPYAPVRSPAADQPIYVGKAVPPGSRKGGKGVGEAKSLHARLAEHAQSISAAANLRVADFRCRYLIVIPLWITMAERFLIEHYRPIWNVCIEGFGAHDPGRGRYEGEASWWDTLHPGRPWAARLRQNKTPERATARISDFLGPPA
jgi:hypothetical protein